MIPLGDRIPGLTDTDLSSLRANAARLVEHGSANQVIAASDIIPLIDTEVARRAALPTATVKKPRAPAKKKVVLASGHQTALAPKAA